MNLAKLLHEATAKMKDAPALARGTRITATYTEHADRSARLANALLNDFGLKSGDRVALAMKNDPAYSEIMFGIWHAGCAAVPMNARLHPKEISWILENSGARVCFASEDLLKDIVSAAKNVPSLAHVVGVGSAKHLSLYKNPLVECADVDSDDLAWLFYTSGTTGRPKGAMLSHGNLRAMNGAYFANVDHITSGDCIIHAAPMSHGSGLYLLPHVERGACQVIPESGGFDPAEVLSLIDSWSGVTLFFAPTMVTRLINAPEFAAANTTNLKIIPYGGAPMYVEDCLQALEKIGPKMVQIYGQGESPMTITVVSRATHLETQHPKYHERLGSVGQAQMGVEVRIVDAEDHELSPGEIGEVLVRGDVVMKGYWQNPDATAEVLRGGWLHTGDMGVLNEDGFLTLKDRLKDVIISGGANIYPREVEEVLLQHAGVLECSVIGRTHPDWGEEIVAFIVAKSDAVVRGPELDALCLENIARFKRPKAYRFIDALPKNNYGKVLKTVLRERI